MSNEDIVSRLTALGALCMLDFPLIPPDAPEVCMMGASEIASLRHEISEIRKEMSKLGIVSSEPVAGDTRV